MLVVYITPPTFSSTVCPPWSMELALADIMRLWACGVPRERMGVLMMVYVEVDAAVKAK
jgi:hypothetical protein